jgi:hypothetical protein
MKPTMSIPTPTPPSTGGATIPRRRRRRQVHSSSGGHGVGGSAAGQEAFVVVDVPPAPALIAPPLLQRRRRCATSSNRQQQPQSAEHDHDHYASHSHAMNTKRCWHTHTTNNGYGNVGAGSLKACPTASTEEEEDDDEEETDIDIDIDEESDVLRRTIITRTATTPRIRNPRRYLVRRGGNSNSKSRNNNNNVRVRGSIMTRRGRHVVGVSYDSLTATIIAGIVLSLMLVLLVALQRIHVSLSSSGGTVLKMSPGGLALRHAGIHNEIAALSSSNPNHISHKMKDEKNKHKLQSQSFIDTSSTSPIPTFDKPYKD